MEAQRADRLAAYEPIESIEKKLSKALKKKKKEKALSPTAHLAKPRLVSSLRHLLFESFLREIACVSSKRSDQYGF